MQLLIFPFAVLAFIIPVLVLYILRKNVVSSDTISLSSYGLIVLIYYIFQATASFINYRKIKGYTTNFNKKTHLVIVGYREDPEYFRNCIEYAQKIENVEKIIVVIDGQEQEDLNMASIAVDVFKCPILNLPELPRTKTDKIFEKITPKINSRYICITQPHEGKRSALFTGICLSLFMDSDSIIVTDSDTMIDFKAIDYMNQTLFSDEKVGAVTGDVRIFNNYTVISFLSSLRYWFAFNLERSAQSFWNSVLCVSGPLGMYKSSVLSTVVEEWVQQKFLGTPCTYGDDRHLTNKVLETGHTVLYDHRAYCYTETPVDLMKWILQQIRWSKSFFREFFYSMKFIYKTSAWTGVELVYQIVYPFFIIFTIFWFLLADVSRTGTLFLLTVILAVGHVKGIVGSFVSRSYSLNLYGVYSLVYICFTLPIKLYAMATFAVNSSWLTAHRLYPQKIEWYPIGFIGLWNAVVLSLFLRVMIAPVQSSSIDIIIGSVVSSVIALEFGIIALLAYNKKKTFSDTLLQLRNLS